MVKRRAIELNDLPPHVRAQAAAQIGCKNVAIGIKRDPSEKKCMNKLESAYASYLEALVHSKNVIRWRFEPLKLRIGRAAYYKPDFMVVVGSFGHEKIELHETKGFWREAARVRIKVAADLFPEFEFIGVQRKGGEWTEERF